MQTSMAVVRGDALQIGDRIPVRFAIYGEVMCPIVSIRPREIGAHAGRLMDVGARIGEDGPAHWTVVRTDEHFTVVR